MDFKNSGYGLIYADPPWPYTNKADTDGRVEAEYDLMNLQDIKELNVPAKENCILYMWTTAPHAENAFEVMSAWGFEYKTQAVWDKKQPMGIGYWLGNEHELLYIGTKGDASPPDPSDKHGSIFREKKTQHSSKPKAVRSYLEKAHPEAEKVELFSRENRVGWDVFGNETPNTQQNVLEAYD
jgi:N6-adenosine-specific RNA methylase IME4